jgi:hypothetical protein
MYLVERTKVAPVYTVSFDYIRVQKFSADASMGVDTVPPTSSVNPIRPYWQESAPFAVSATASDALSGVTNAGLYYRSSIDNVNWGEWKLFGADNVAPYEWSFAAPDGYALYEFYSVATDAAGNVEAAPAVADAFCGVVIPATIDIDPDTLNLKSRGKWITAYIELPSGYNLADIDVSSIKLQGVVQAELHPTEVGDHDGDGVPDLMVKFDRSAVQALLESGEVKLTITGKWHAVLFKGSDVIRVIESGEGQHDYGNESGTPPCQSQSQGNQGADQGNGQGQGNGLNQGNQSGQSNQGAQQNNQSQEPPQVPSGQSSGQDGGNQGGQNNQGNEQGSSSGQGNGNKGEKGPPKTPPGQNDQPSDQSQGNQGNQGNGQGNSNGQGNGNQGNQNEQGNQGNRGQGQSNSNNQGNGEQGQGDRQGNNNGNQGKAKGK